MKGILCVRSGESFCTTLHTVLAYFQTAVFLLVVLSLMISGWIYEISQHKKGLELIYFVFLFAGIVFYEFFPVNF
jgi:hypothetical protein